MASKGRTEYGNKVKNLKTPVINDYGHKKEEVLMQSEISKVKNEIDMIQKKNHLLIDQLKEKNKLIHEMVLQG